MMKKLFLTFVILSLSQAVHAKDLLVPAFIDQQGYSGELMLDYDKLSQDEKEVIDTIKSNKQELQDGVSITRIAPTKDVVAEPEITPQAKEESEVALQKEPETTILDHIAVPQPKPLAKVIAKKVVKPIEPIFNIPSLQLQKRLDCPITPTLKDIDRNQPKLFNRTNNARRKTKNPEVSGGHVLYIKGRILDINCVPIQGAVVKLWHANAYGGFDHLINEYDPKYDPYFAGSALATSDNIGNFNFITILPGRTNKHYAPDINFQISHKDFPEMNTKYFFPDNKFNEEDPRFASLDNVSKELLTGILLPINPDNFEEGYYYLVDFVFDGVSRFRN